MDNILLLNEFSTVDEINSSQTFNLTLFSQAVESNDDSTIESIIRKLLFINREEISDLKGMVREIFDKRMEFIDIETKAGYSRLHIAVMDNEPAIIEYLLEHELIDPNKCGVPIGTPLHLAILLNHSQCIETLLRYDINVDIMNKHQQTALDMAIENGLWDLLPRFFTLTQQINRQTEIGLTLIQMAIICDWAHLIDDLLDSGADILIPVKKPDDAAMTTMVASLTSRKPLLPLSSVENSVTLYLKLYGKIDSRLLDKLTPFNIKMSDGNGNSLLHLAASMQLVDLCKCLLGRGVDVQGINNYGNNALQQMLRDRQAMKPSIKNSVLIGTALINSGLPIYMGKSQTGSITNDVLSLNHEKFFQLCLENAVDIDYASMDFRSIVKRRWFATAKQLIVSMSRDLVDRHINMEIVQFYCKHSSIDDLKFLLGFCKDDLVDQILPTVLFDLAANNDHDKFSQLLKIPVHKPQFIPNGETLLTALIKNDNQDFIDKLMDSSWKEVSLNSHNKAGQSPLHVAIVMRNKSLIEILIFEHGDFNVKESNGETIFSILFKSFSNQDEMSFVEKIAKIMITAKANPLLPDGNNIASIDHCSNSTVKSKILNYAQKRNIGAQSSENTNNTECKICISKPVQCILDCGHVYCDDCAARFTRCPTCRKPSLGKRKIFF